MTRLLKEVLDELHVELAGHPALDAVTRDALRKVVGEIALALEEGATEKAPDSTKSLGLSSRVQSFVDEFELQHPQLTKTLSTIAERLADMGI